MLYAREGADLTITALPAEQRDASETQSVVEREIVQRKHDRRRRCLVLEGDLTEERFCRAEIEGTIEALGRLDFLVSCAAQA